jgi:hypothetical protein
MTKKYLYALLICLIVILFTPQVLGAGDRFVARQSRDRSCVYYPEVYRGLELGKLSEELTNNGLIGSIHGAVGQSQLYVLSIREPDDFFTHREFSLLPQDAASLDILNQVKRHDRLCVKGNFIENPSPQKHIAVNSIKLLEAWQQPQNLPPYEHKVNIPQELRERNSFIGKVHAISEDSKVLVVEYEDGVIPIFVTATEYTRGLYRGDIIKLTYNIQPYPSQPTHLQLDTTADKPLEVIDAIATWNGKQQTLSGSLVKFPQSPQIKFDVYAIEVDTQGVKRYFTLVNFDNIEEFENIRQKLANIWEENAATATSGRNMLINPEVTLEARGSINIISLEQANPQILLDNAGQIKQL